ncbi:MAG: DOMON domain-containing protein [candidate division WOR-3 bacterium]|jgi:hypothetical protein
MKKGIAVLFALALGVQIYAQQKIDTLMVPYDSLMDYRVSVDGYIDVEDNEYPAAFRDPATGITVHWGHDDSLIYIGMEARGKGWLAIGFGSPVMSGSNMIIGFYADDSAGVVNHVGAGRLHRPPKGNENLIEDWEIDYDDESNTVVMEFVYPLQWQGLTGTAVSGLLPEHLYDLILARNPRTISLAAKHAQKSHRVFALAPNPAAEPNKSQPENK